LVAKEGSIDQRKRLIQALEMSSIIEGIEQARGFGTMIHKSSGRLWQATRNFQSKYYSTYDQTFKNLSINRDTRVICQGFTGKQVFKF
jgi:hypothetical protein